MGSGSCVTAVLLLTAAASRSDWTALKRACLVRPFLFAKNQIYARINTLRCHCERSEAISGLPRSLCSLAMTVNKFITNNSAQTRKLGELLAEELRGGPARNASRSDAGGEIICLMGELGSGKTTFSQGMLKGLGAKRPYTSPTFVVMKHYKKEIPISKSQFPKKIQSPRSKIQNLYHIDAYRVGAKDLLELGWEEIVSDKKNIVIVEWAERIKAIVPDRAVWIKFEHLKGDGRKLRFLNS